MKSIAFVGTKVQRKQQAALRGDSLARKLLLSRLHMLQIGQLIIRDNDEVLRYEGNTRSDLVAEICVNDHRAYSKVIFGGTIGAGEAYMLGFWSSPDPTSVVKLMVANQAYLNNMDSGWSWLKKSVANVADMLRINSLSGSKKNIVAHYDLSNDFFELFLDPSMMYSSAIYRDADMGLEEASEYKLAHVCERLQLKESDHLVEIGSGWGGMAIYAAKHYGCRVTTTTISEEQYALAHERIHAANLQHKITLLKKDYRELEGRFDKLVSIEMIEAVGHEYYEQFFKKCDSLLKDDGLALIQAITTGDHRFEKEKNKADFIRRYIFPGGCLPSNHVIAEMTKKHTRMHAVGFEDITLHYARTLMHWRERFMAKLPEVRQQGFDDVFIRMWEFYLAYCEGGFAERVIHTGQFLFAKPLCKTLPPVRHI